MFSNNKTQFIYDRLQISLIFNNWFLFVIMRTKCRSGVGAAQPAQQCSVSGLVALVAALWVERVGSCVARRGGAVANAALLVCNSPLLNAIN